MENQFVPYNIALLLKDLGFNHACFASYYDRRGKMHLCLPHEKQYLDDFDTFLVSAPLWQQVVDWLNEKNIYISYNRGGSFNNLRYVITYHCTFRDRLNDLFETDKEKAFLCAISLIKKELAKPN